MDLHVSLDAGGDLAGQIYRQVRAAILDGRLRPGDHVPSTRELAARLEVSRNTAGAAYDRLTAEGFLTARVGVGTFVSDHVRRPRGGDRDDRGGDRDDRGGGHAVAPLRPRRPWDGWPEPPDLSATAPAFDFRPGMPAAGLFPFATWRALLAEHLRPSAVHTGAYGDPAGHPGLRAALARHLGVARGVSARAEDVLVTCGTQQALDLVGRVLVGPGDVVAVEDPGYPPARRVFEALGARVVGVPVDAAGIVVDELPGDARLVYVTPSHQFPLGVPMSLARRLALLDWAERTGAVVVEDDYDSEFRYAGRPLEPLHTLGPNVVYVGSFSKTLLPTLRLGFCVAPPALRAALRRAKYVLDWHTALPMQAALAAFVDRGLFARHVRRLRDHYRRRRDLIVHTLRCDFADVLEPISPLAGLHLSALLRSGSVAEADALARRAGDRGVEVVPLSAYAVGDRATAGLALGFGVVPAERIGEGLRRLRECCVDVHTEHRGTG